MSSLSDKRALLVEDETMVALLIEDMLTELGCQVVVTESKLSRAFAQAGSAAIDFAILDVNLAGQMTYPVADVLRARGVPFVFATGYGGGDLPAGYRGVEMVEKPFGLYALQAAVERLLAPVAA